MTLHFAVTVRANSQQSFVIFQERRPTSFLMMLQAQCLAGGQHPASKTCGPAHRGHVYCLEGMASLRQHERFSTPIGIQLTFANLLLHHRCQHGMSGCLGYQGLSLHLPQLPLHQHPPGGCSVKPHSSKAALCCKMRLSFGQKQALMFSSEALMPMPPVLALWLPLTTSPAILTGR